MEKILIFYSSYGGGHFSAAKSIENHIKSHYPKKEVKLVDCIEYINKHLNKLLAESYNEAAKKAPLAWKTAYHLSNDGITSKAVTTSNKLFSIKLNKLLQDFRTRFDYFNSSIWNTNVWRIKKERKNQLQTSNHFNRFSHSRTMASFQRILWLFLCFKQSNEKWYYWIKKTLIYTYW